MPDYNQATLDELVSHFLGYKVGMSYRYHSLLSAAWAGCKIVALERSSKISALSMELGISLVTAPLNYEKLCAGFESACVIPKSVLEGFAQRAQDSTGSLLGKMERL